MSEILDTGTWRWKSGLATWHYCIPMEGRSPADALRDAACKTWSALEGFATAVSAEWYTLSVGEGALVLQGADLDATRFQRAFEDLVDVTDVDLALDLHCVGVSGQEAIVRNGAFLYFELEWPDPDKPGEGFPDLDVVFMLDVDIYAPWTIGVNPDNRALAAVNGPRLTAFLRRLRNSLGAELVSLDAFSGPGIIDEDGFLPTHRGSTGP